LVANLEPVGQQVTTAICLSFSNSIQVKKTGVGPPLHYYLKEDFINKAFQVLEIIAKVITMRNSIEEDSDEAKNTKAGFRNHLAYLSEYFYLLVPFHYPKQGLLEILGKADVEEKLALLQVINSMLDSL
jgi:hypothetical protein